MTHSGVATPRSRSWLTPKHLSLRRGLILLLIAALLPITVLSILQGMVRLESRRAIIIKQLSASAEALADSNETLLGGTKTMLRVAALNPAVREGGAGCGQVLRDILALSPAYANLTRYGADGGLLCSALPPPGGFSLAGTPAWQQISRSRLPLVSEAILGPFTKKRVAMVVLPLRSSADRFEGSLGVAVDLAWLDKRLRGRIADDDTGVAVISDSGQVMVASRPLPKFDIALPIGSIGRTRDSAGMRWSYTIVPAVRPGPGQQGIYVAYAAPEPPTFGFAWWQTIIDFTLPVLAILLASLAIWFGTKQLVIRWLVGLQHLALHFAGGDYRRRPVNFSEAPREIRSVAASLYRMSSAVSERDQRLRDSLERQRLLARELHHRVKNNFQMVMSLLSLQSSRLQDENARTALDQARRRIGALALVHRQLYDTGELANISSRALLGALCQQLQPLAGSGVTLACDVDDVPVDIDTAVPLTLWLVETVNNAIHHAFPAPQVGRVDAIFRVVDGAAVLTVIDDGIGVGADDLAGEGRNGQGMRLIKALAAQLGGTATVVGDPGGGSIATLKFQMKAMSQHEPEPPVGADVISSSQ